jgi:predicted esterase
MALNYAVQYPVKGLLLTSPYRSLEEPMLSSYSKFQFPVHIIWGSEDNIVPEEELRTLTDKLPTPNSSPTKAAATQHTSPSPNGSNATC